MKKIPMVYEFDSAERYIICQLAYEAMKKMEDENGEIEHLTVTQKKIYDVLHGIYQTIG